MDLYRRVNALIEGRKDFSTCLILVLLAFATFWGMFNHEFVHYDDYRIIVNRAGGLDGFSWDNISAILWENYPREEPLIVRDFSYLLNANFFGVLQPLGYLLGNFLLHILCSFLLYKFCLQIFPQQWYIGFLAAVIFVVHPIHVESVAWISARKDTLYSGLFLLAVISYGKYWNSLRYRYLSYSFLLFILSLFSKAGAIAFLPFLMLLRLTIFREKGITWRECCFYLLVALATLFFVKWYGSILTEFGIIRMPDFGERDWARWFIINLEALRFYLEKLICPSGLAIVYDFPKFGTGLFNVPVSIVVATATFCTALSIWILKKRGNWRLLFLLGWFPCVLLPYMNPAEVGIYVADRYTYLASGSFVILAAWLFVFLYQTAGAKKYGIRWLIAFVLILYVSLLVRQSVSAVHVWKNTETLWGNVLHVSPDNVSSYAALMGYYIGEYQSKRRVGDADVYLLRAKRIGDKALRKFSLGEGKYPTSMSLIMSQLGTIAWYEGLTEEVDRYFNAGFQLKPNYLESRYFYALILFNQKRLIETARQIKIIEKLANPSKDKAMLVDLNTNIKPFIPLSK